METKKEVIRMLERKIEGKKNAIKHDIPYLINALNEIDSSLDVISYLLYLKDEFIKKDGV